MENGGNLLSDRPFLIYLASKMVEDFIQRFYESHACVISAYRMLPPVAQKCFLYLLYSPGSDWKTWPKRRHMLSVYQSLRLLLQLGIAEGDIESDLHLNLDFRMQFLSSLLSSSADLSGICFYEDVDGKARRRKVDEKELLKDCTERWECILRYLALPSSISSSSHDNIVERRDAPDLTGELFQYIGFTKPNGNELEISSSGFQFLLLNKVEQIWTYLIYFFKYLEEKLRLDVFPLVDFFLKLLLSVGTSEDDSKCRPMLYDDNWPQGIKTFITHLRELGFVYMKKRKDGFFFVTPLLRILALSSGSATTPYGMNLAAATEGAVASLERTVENTSLALKVSHGFLIVETNFRVYAYTDSALQLAILSTFSELTYRFENVVVGILTRDSVRRALQAGITAKQIVQYLRSNAHPQAITTHGQNSTPMTVIDQINLWEQERKRLSCQPSTLYSTFDSEDDFLALRNFAQQCGVLEWHCNVQKLIVVGGDEGHELVREWWRTHQRQHTQKDGY